jgi:transaldolase
MTKPAVRAAALGQSIWYDNISRDLLESGAVARLVAEEGVRGITSNPAIFEKAMSKSPAYAAQFEALVADGCDAKSIYEACAIRDIRDGADALAGVFAASIGRDGFVSLEVSPALAHDTAGTLAEARRLWGAVERDNLMIKIPATRAGILAIRAAIADGIIVNVTLIFALSAYADVIEAYLCGLEDSVARDLPLGGVNSVASFFVSRVDSSVDAALEARAASHPADRERASALLGKTAIANAKVAYALFEERFSGPRFTALEQRGAAVQRPLWASTSSKNKAYPDTIYVDTLIGPHTVNTLPPATLTAFNDHGTTAVTVRDDLSGARATLAALPSVGVDLDRVCDELLTAGVRSFADAFDALLSAVEGRRSAVPSR